MNIIVPKIGEVNIKAKCAVCDWLISSNEKTVATQEGLDEKIIKRLPTTICSYCQPKK